MKMKTKIILLPIVLVVITFASCQKDTDLFIPDGTSVGLDTNWVASVTDLSPVSEIKRLIKKDIVLDSIDATAGGTLQTSEGLTVIVLPQSLALSNGLLASGRVYVETMLVKQRGDMIRLDKPTTSLGRVLVSGGEVFIRIRKESEELHLAPGKGIYIKFAEPTPSTQMKLFYGDESNTERFNWLADSSGGSNGTTIGVTTQPTLGYEFFSNRLRWINCDYFADTSAGRVVVSTSFAADYTNANTAVYLVFKDLKSVAGMYGDVTSKKFSSAKVPTGKAAIVVSISKKGTNSYYLGHETITTGQTSLNGVQIVPLKPQPTSLTDIKAYLATL
jgi:hypothetical protein